jgi:hypothetical protein
LSLIVPSFRVRSLLEDTIILVATKIFLVPFRVEHNRVDAAERDVIALAAKVDSLGEYEIFSFSFSILLSLFSANLVQIVVYLRDLQWMEQKLHLAEHRSENHTMGLRQAGLMTSHTTSSSIRVGSIPIAFAI